MSEYEKLFRAVKDGAPISELRPLIRLALAEQKSALNPKPTKVEW